MSKGLSASLMTPHPWPRLSEDLEGPREPGVCQSCGRTAENDHVKITPWQEYDDHDQREQIFVLLCATCSNTLVGPHPRLYDYLPENKPEPGLMAICSDCLWRRGIYCENPHTTRNGGLGLRVDFPQPMLMHVSMKDRSKSGWHTFYPGPATACAGRLTRETVQDEEGGFDDD